MKKRLTPLLVTFILLIPSYGIFPETACPPVEVRNLPAGLHVEIRPEMELLAGVLSQTSWMNIRGPKGSGNEYFREIRSFFSAYRDHAAVRIAEALTKRGFTYDAPPGFILSLGPLPDLIPLNGYTDYLRTRAGGGDELERFRVELVNLARESKFADFFESRRTYLENMLSSCGQDFRGTEVIEWLQRFFGATGDDYFLVFAPAFPSGGGYGFTHIGPTGRKAVYEIVRENGTGTGRPEFPNGRSLEWLTFHEWGHSFVNPAVESAMGRFPDLESLFVPVRRKMTATAYGQPLTFFNEQILRATTLLRMAELYGPEACESALAGETRQGFYLSAFTLERLRRYGQDRTSYPEFADFLPMLFEDYRSHRAELLASAPAENVPELKEIRVNRILPSGDGEISNLKPPVTNSFLLDVTFLPSDPLSGDQVDEFLVRAGFEFDLTAGGAGSVPARIYQGNRYTTPAGTFWGFWVGVADNDATALKPGVSYRPVIRKPDPEFRWSIGDDIRITFF